jgi:hypothetical protein
MVVMSIRQIIFVANKSKKVFAILVVAWRVTVVLMSMILAAGMEKTRGCRATGNMVTTIDPGSSEGYLA